MSCCNVVKHNMNTMVCRYNSRPNIYNSNLYVPIPQTPNPPPPPVDYYRVACPPNNSFTPINCCISSICNK